MDSSSKELARILEEDVGLGPMLFNGQEQVVQWKARDGNNSARTDQDLNAALGAVEDLVGTITDEEISKKLRAILAELEKVYKMLRERPKAESVEPVYNTDLERIMLIVSETLDING